MTRMHVIKAPFRERMYRRRFIVPNAVTLGNLFCGFLSIIYSCSDRYEKALIAIGIALLLDGLDGRLARRLQATSKFGVEFDSFSDLVSFGLAPALLIYQWAFRQGADEFGVLMTFSYALCAAGRLARFNVAQSDNLSGFTGLPTPAAAALVVTTVNLFPRIQPSDSLTAISATLMGGLAFLMVSKFDYVSVKKFKMKGGELFILLGALIALLWYFDKTGLFLVSLAYVLSGPVWSNPVRKFLRLERKNADKTQPPADARATGSDQK